MATSFPGAFDAFVNPGANDLVTVVSHAAQHDNINDAVAALEAKVGITNSADAASLDYKVARNSSIRGTFTNSTLSSGVLTVAHALALSAPYMVNVVIFDNNSKQHIPGDVTGSANSVAIDLAAEGALTGTWGYMISS